MSKDGYVGAEKVKEVFLRMEGELELEHLGK